MITAMIDKRGKHSVKTFVTFKHHHESMCFANKLKLPILCVCVSVCLVGVLAQDPGLI